MAKSLYVGNLAWTVTEEELGEAFAQFGEVLSAKIIYDRETGRSRGFGFVEMEDAQAEEAIRGLDGTEMFGRTVKVNESKPRAPRPKRW